MAKIIKLKNNEGEYFLPQTSISAVNGLSQQLNNKQDKLVAGDNISIVDGVISSSGGGTGTLRHENDQAAPSGRKHIKILSIGNSFSQDSMAYVPMILKELCPDDLDFTIGIVFTGGSTLQGHQAVLTKQTVTSFLDKDHLSYTYDPNVWMFNGWNEYKKFKSTESKWVMIKEGTAQVKGAYKEDIIDEDWDILLLHQDRRSAFWCGPESSQDLIYYQIPFIDGDSSKGKYGFDQVYEPWAKNIQDIIKAQYPNIKFGWYLIHSGSAQNNTRSTLDLMYEGIRRNTRTIVDRGYAQEDLIFPYGTAIQNLRQYGGDIKDVGGCSTHYLLAPDGTHLQEGLPCLTAAYVNAQTILNYLGIDKSIKDSQWQPSLQILKDLDIPGPHPDYNSNTALTESDVIVGLSSSNIEMAKKAALAAIEKPFELTDLSQYTPSSQEPDSSDGPIISTIVNNKDQILYPRTIESAIMTDDGNPLSSKYLMKSETPTKLSELENDLVFTEAQKQALKEELGGNNDFEAILGDIQAVLSEIIGEDS